MKTLTQVQSVWPYEVQKGVNALLWTCWGKKAHLLHALTIAVDYYYYQIIIIIIIIKQKLMKSCLDKIKVWNTRKD